MDTYLTSYGVMDIYEDKTHMCNCALHLLSRHAWKLSFKVCPVVPLAKGGLFS